ncbi:BMP family ABC transporter substrate-binding protein [Spirochaetia bacterium]|nr:BMP family ABC transporter substrate-binding protein [Spirochaetia bacterium]
MKKGVRNIVFSVLMWSCLALLGCEKRSDAEFWKAGVPMNKKAVKIGVIYRTDPLVSINMYDHAHYAGILKMQQALGLQDDQVIHKTDVSDVDPVAVEYGMRECIARGANIIIATSDGYMETCGKLAAEFPNVIFATTAGAEHNETNLTNYFGRVYQARYLSGIVAGLKTATNKIGYVAAMGKENNEVTCGLNAFALGVESVNPLAGVYVVVTSDWYDPDGETRAARALIEDGCDVIAQHCDTGNPQIEAGKAGVWGIGYNEDMENLAPAAVLTSVLWRWEVYYTDLVQSVMDGAFTTEPYLGNMTGGIVSLARINESIAAPGTTDIMTRARDQIFNDGFDIFYGEMLTNDGQLIGGPGRYLSTDEIRGSHWYYHTIKSVN